MTNNLMQVTFMMAYEKQQKQLVEQTRNKVVSILLKIVVLQSCSLPEMTTMLQIPAMLQKTFLILLTALAGFSSCKNPDTGNAGKRVLTVTILPQKYVVERIAGSQFIVNVLIPEEGNHETYEPTAKQMVDAGKSEAYFKVGHLSVEESWLSKLTGTNPGMKVYDTSEGFDLLYGEPCDHGDHSHEGGIDPHTWLSVSGVRVQAGVILKALIELDPDNSAHYHSNHAGFIESLDSLDNQIRKLITASGVNSFMIYHPSLGYFARDYQLEQIAIEQEGKEPSPAYMKELVDIALDRKLNTLFISSQFSKQSALVIADQINAKVEEFNPSAADWSSNMLEIAQKIAGSETKK